MIIDTILDRKTLTVKWENVWNIPEFNKLIETKQSTVWHKEGNVSVHTKMVVDAMYNEIINDKKDNEYSVIMILSALFHDIGKGVATFFNKEKNNWSAKNHAEYGEKIARKLLWGESPIIRESVCYFVRNHMKPMYLIDSPTCVKDTIELSCDGLYPQYCNLKNLILLKKCDNLGSIFDYDGWYDKLNFVQIVAEKFDCYTKPYKFENDVTKWHFLNENTEDTPKLVADESSFNVYVPIGSKSFENTPTIPFVIQDKNEDITDDLILTLEGGEPFVLKLNLDENKVILETIFSLIYLYHGRIVFIYGSDVCENYLSPNMCMGVINKN